MRGVARWMASSRFLARGREVFARNAADINLPLSRLEKLLAGSWLLLQDYGEGRFPPRFPDRAAAHAAEVAYGQSLPGFSEVQFVDGEIRKPYWGSSEFNAYSHSFGHLLKLVEEHTQPDTRQLLELGCGSGWVAEFLATSGYPVLATTISPLEVSLAERRIAALREKGIETPLAFRVAPMESIREELSNGEMFDLAYVFEALHHAFDWRAAIRSVYACLKDGGVFIIANEPNELHTFIAYRGARLANTHEIGMRRRELLDELKRAGFSDVRVLRPRINDRLTPHWIVSRR